MNIAQLFFSTSMKQTTPIKMSDEDGPLQLLSFEHLLNGMSFHKNEAEMEPLHLQSFDLMKEQVDHEQLNELLFIMQKGEINLSFTDHEEGEESDVELHSSLIKPIQPIHLDESKREILADLTFEGIIKEEDFVQLPVQIQSQWVSLAKEINEVLASFIDDRDLPETANSLIKLLDRWSKLSQVNLNYSRQDTQPPIEFTDEKFQNLWRKLFTAYERRNSLNQMGQYNNEAKVDQKTVVKWLQNALKNLDELSVTSPRIQHHQSSPINLTFPMSRIEQYVIHIQQSDQSQTISVEQQLIDKFSQAIRTSRFLSMNNGVNQMMFHLKPDNLGEMMVRLVEVNGEMTAKIIVTSEATKKALQSNIHQLKNVFSPNQVVIERQDELTSQLTQEEQEHLRERDDNDEQSFHKQSKDGQEKELDDSESFRDILNEKV